MAKSKEEKDTVIDSSKIFRTFTSVIDPGYFLFLDNNVYLLKDNK